MLQSDRRLEPLRSRRLFHFTSRRILMAAQKQIEANCRNARRSAGPHTEEGRRASSLDALTHALRSRLTVIPGEDLAEYQDLFDRYLDLFQPRNVRDLDAVHKVVTCQWRLRRVSVIESEMFSQTIQARLRAPLGTGEQLAAIFTPGRAPDYGRPGPASASLASCFLGGGARHFNTVARYEASLERAQRNAFRYLDSRPAPASAGESGAEGPGLPGEPVPPAGTLTSNGAEASRSAREQSGAAARLSNEPESAVASTSSRSDPEPQAEPNEPNPAAHTAQTPAAEPELAARTQSPRAVPLPGAPGGALAA
jgi:hypothetical protein